MTGMFRRLFHFITIIVWSLSVEAQEFHASRHITSASGLSNDFVISLAMDGNGYVWVATEAGVNRIAGNVCQPFPLTEQVSGHRITALYWHEPSDQMLIGTENGLTIYNPKSGTTRQLTDKEGLAPSSINAIVNTDNEDLWIIHGNGQVSRLNGRTFQITNIKLSQPHSNRCALDDKRGNLYIGHSRDGMTVVKQSDGTSINYQHHPNNPNSLPGNNVRCIYQDTYYRIWVGTDRGLALFHPETSSFSKVTPLPNDHDDNVYDILQVNDSTLWVATDIGGIKVVRPNHIGKDGHLHYDTTTIKLTSLNTRCLKQDEYGNIWVGNHSTGVDFISILKSDFNLLDYKDPENDYYPVNSIVKDTGHGFLVASETELTQWQNGKITGRWSYKNKTRRAFHSPRCMMVDHWGHVWIGLDDQGIYRFDKKDGRFSHVGMSPEGSDIHTFAEDTDGSIWIGGEFGIYKYIDGKVSRQENISQIVRAPATCILNTAPHQLFIATLGDGIYSYNMKTKTCRHLNVQNGLPSSKINQTIRDQHQGLWLATDAGLVYLEDPINLTGIRIFSQEHGLADNHILALQQDHDGRIWMSTYSGISCFVKSTGKCHNYNHQETRVSGGYINGAAMTDADGTIYFGSAFGACYFKPEQLNDQMEMSDVQIVTFEAYNPVGRNTEMIQLTPDSQRYIHTTYEQNTIRLTFTVRNYAQKDFVEYSYIMKGMDGKWYNIGNDHDVVFRGLRPGHYTFILRAKLRSQDWGDAKETQLEIYIAPPLWQTWWAYLLYALMMILWGTWLVRSYKNKLALRASLELEKRENQQKQNMNEERLRFFTNITHELRTPLTLILGPLDDLMDDRQLPASSRRLVAMIQKSAKRLQRLINEIMEFRKTETQNRRLTVARGDIGQHVREICLNYKELYRNPKVQFVYNIAENLPSVWFDSEIITTILNNYLSNAIKYTEQGSITTTVQAEADRCIRISVADTGYGISPDALPHIFERYYQANGSHQASGTGIGLALVKSLADLHEAQVSVDSHEGQGSRFTLSLDIHNNYPNALHKEDQENEELRMKKEVFPSAPLLLVVDDNADIRQYIADSFCDDFRISQATNGEEGVQMAKEQIPDIIISDIMMPKLNGIQLTHQLKEDIRTSHIPIILLTAKNTDEDKEDGYDSGADSYLTKPFTTKLLASRIQNLLTSRRRLAEYITHHPEMAEEDTSSTVTPQLGRLDREFLDKLNGIIRDNVMSQDIDLPFITDKMAMSHSTFYRKVKALTGLTAKEYIRKFRLQHCYHLLESGEYNVNQAAMMTGFNQMAHFRETFKNEFGILPSEVIKRKKL
jgi:signal transduction histidine kinase/ligand-binding sensor domain-containing protein/CheY-like chemotaxis protein